MIVVLYWPRRNIALKPFIRLPVSRLVKHTKLKTKQIIKEHANG